MMKKIFSILATVLVLASCVKDLNTLPLNPTDTTSETAYTAEEVPISPDWPVFTSSSFPATSKTSSSRTPAHPN